MNDQPKQEASNGSPIVAPETIARSLEDVVTMLQGQQIDAEMERTIARMLRSAARNTRMLFELEADENGRFDPKNMGQVFFLVDLLMRSDMAPSSYKNNPASIAIGVMKAKEIGVDPIGGISGIMVVNNRPSVWGDLAQALIQRSGALEKQIEAEIGTAPANGMPLPDWPDDYGFTVTTWRKGQEEPYVGTYTVADAKQAKLWMDSRRTPWLTDPKAMLFNRARARSYRKGFSDCLFGMGLVEEQADFVTAGPTKYAELPAPPSDDDEPVEKIEHQPEVLMNDFGGGEPIPSTIDAAAPAEELQPGQEQSLPLEEKE